MNRISLTALAVVLCSSLALQAAPTTLTGPPVYTNPIGSPTYNDAFAANTWLRTDVRGGSSIGVNDTFPRNGDGSVFMNGLNSSSKGDLTYLFGTPVRLGDLQSLSYDWYRSSDSTNPGAQAPVIRLFIDADGDLSTTNDLGFLIYEPTYNGFGIVPTDEWQTSSLDLDNGNFWWRQVTPAGASEEIFNRTIADILDLNRPGFSTITADSLVYGVNVGFGSGWNGEFIGAVDNISWQFQGQELVSFNFDASESAVIPEPASLTLWGTLAGLGALVAWRRKRAIG